MMILPAPARENSTSSNPSSGHASSLYSLMEPPCGLHRHTDVAHCRAQACRGILSPRVNDLLAQLDGAA